MNIRKINIVLSIIFLFVTFSVTLGENPLIYLSPMPDAKMVSIHTNLIVRFNKEWNNKLDPLLLNFVVTGEKSGNHQGNIIRTADRKTYIFKSHQPFETNEIVNVKINADYPGFNGPINYRFITSKTKNNRDQSLDQTIPNMEKPATNQSRSDGITSVINGVAVPSDFPLVAVDISEEPSPGKLFMANEGGIPYIMIFENDGTPYFYQRRTDYSRDFKVQPTGTLTRRDREFSAGFVEMDTNFQIIDTLVCGNGYGTDQHEAQILPNGNYLLIALDVQFIDMSELIEGGNPNARVYGNHVLEHDPDGNVIFEWRSWDHYNIVDAEHVNLRAITIDYVHMNSIAVDFDSNLVVSSRHLSEVTKINRQTGEVIWRLGGINNQFTFINDDNDEEGISYQHDARPVSGKENHYTIFDNGNHKPIQYSRAVEFLIDTTTMTATNIWEYRHTPDRYAYAMGNAQRLPNGNTLINWSGNPHPIATEVNPEGEVVHEMRFVNGEGMYRTFKFDWTGMSEKPYLILENHDDHVSLIFNKFGDTNVKDYLIYAGLEPNPITVVDSTSETWIDLNDFKYNERYYFRVTARNHQGEESGFSNEENTLINFITPGENLIFNGDFSEGDDFWNLEVSDDASAEAVVENGIYHINIDTSGNSELDIQLKQPELLIQQGRHYILEFDAYADNIRTIEVNVEKATIPFDNYSRIGFVLIEKAWSHYRYEFEMSDPSDFSAQLVINCGHENENLHLDNIVLKEDISASIANSKIDVPDQFRLFQNYPNPFNPTTAIGYQLSAVSEVDLSIYNLLGQKIAVLVSEKQSAGRYQVEWNGSEFASGVYYYKLSTSSGFTQTKKLILLR